MADLAAFGPGRAEAPPEGPHPRTAVRVDESGPQFLDAHFERLIQASGPKATWLLAQRDSLLAWIGPSPCALRLAVDPKAQVLWATREALPDTPNPYMLLPQLHPLPPLERARHKGLDGRWGTPLLTKAALQGAADVLLHWPDGEIAETAIASVALEAYGALLVPPLAGRVAGLAERLVLPEWAKARGLAVRSESFTLEDAFHHPLWCANALRGIWRAELHLPSTSTD